jgi:alkylhydroperoxidase/carboxymuconolactone decarboxylase family protein YurZ
MRSDSPDERGPVIEALRAIVQPGSGGLARPASGGLDNRTRALVSVGAALVGGSPPVVVNALVAKAFAAGATTDEVVAVLLVVAPMLGSALLVTKTSEVAQAIGYDIDLALEAPNSEET